MCDVYRVADTLVNHLETSNNASEVQEFVTQCPNFPESAFVKVLKICARLVNVH